ncbi:MAG: peptide chain release factor 1 [Bradymonadia bacterium]|jgi:peptide chain release factor 1
MFQGLQEVEGRYEELKSQLSDPSVASDHEVYSRVHKELSDMEPLVTLFRELRDAKVGLAEAKEMMRDDDPDMKEMAKFEHDEIEARIPQIESELTVLMLPKDPLDEKNIMLEIRAGAGGDESALFAGNLFNMYSRFAIDRGWKVSVVSASEGTQGGYKDLVAEIIGTRVYSTLKWESGVHRVQRVPETEAQGRVHTSTATVAVLPEAEDVDIEVRGEDVRTDVFRASGAGGQHVNRTESAVRLTHLPTGLVVSCQDEKSQLKNKSRAMKVLKSRLFDLETQKRNAERADERRGQVGTGDRSERIRTYNFPQNRLTDHRIGLTLYKLDKVVMGELDELIDALNAHSQAAQLAARDVI